MCPSHVPLLHLLTVLCLAVRHLAAEGSSPHLPVCRRMQRFSTTPYISHASSTIHQTKMEVISRS